MRVRLAGQAVRLAINKIVKSLIVVQEEGFDFLFDLTIINSLLKRFKMLKTLKTVHAHVR